MSAAALNIETGERTPLGGVAVFGRKPECTFFLPDQRVSRQHAIIRAQGPDEYWFTDLGSFNGSRVNDQRVTTSRRLQNGDVITIQDFQFRFELETSSSDPASDATLPDVTLMSIQSINVIMLVSDLKGFTGLSEKLPPDDLAQVVGGWYKACNQILEKEGATIDKFIGDAVFAYWLESAPQARDKAVAAARALLDSCEDLRETHAQLLAPSGSQ